MDDLALLTEMADRTPLPTEADLAPARARLMSTIDEERTPRRGRRLAWSGVTVIGLAAAITGVFAIGGFGVAPPKASAAEVLHEAAAYARSLPDTPPRPDQFVFTRSEGADGVFAESWLSADGTRDGLAANSYDTFVLPGCKDGKKQAYREAELLPGMFEPCEPEPAYDPAMPTDEAGMRTYLAEVHHASADNVNDLAKTIWELLGSHYVSPQSLAAMFDVLAQTDGLMVEENVTDSLGRLGIGVTWTHEGRPITIVFDSETYRLLGSTTWTSLVATGVVDEVGQRP